MLRELSKIIEDAYPTEKMRAALGEADPYRKGFETFKAEAIEAESAVQQAAE